MSKTITDDLKKVIRAFVEMPMRQLHYEATKTTWNSFDRSMQKLANKIYEDRKALIEINIAILEKQLNRKKIT